MSACPNCEMYIASTVTCWGCMMGKACGSPERCGTPPLHACPEPLPRDIAEMLAANFSIPGAGPISPTLKARIVLGLKRPHTALATHLS